MSTPGIGGDRVDDRIRREATFHDEAAQSDTRDRATKFYSITRRSHAFFLRTIFDDVAGRSVLEYGCGTGSNTAELARLGARVTGIDISPVALEVARHELERAGLAERVDLRVMNAEKLELPDASFDRICGTGILHHLDLDACYSEIHRVLKPGGTAIFEEPMGHNPLINWYRNRTPEMRTPDEHPLLRDDIRKAHRIFGQVHTRYFHLTSLALFPLRNTPVFDPLCIAFEGFDRALMTVVPPLKAWAWMAVVVMRK